jgi:hypothetical protein
LTGRRSAARAIEVGNQADPLNLQWDTVTNIGHIMNDLNAAEQLSVLLFLSTGARLETAGRQAKHERQQTAAD